MTSVASSSSRVYPSSENIKKRSGEAVDEPPHKKGKSALYDSKQIISRLNESLILTFIENPELKDLSKTLSPDNNLPVDIAEMKLKSYPVEVHLQPLRNERPNERNVISSFGQASPFTAINPFPPSLNNSEKESLRIIKLLSHALQVIEDYNHHVQTTFPTQEARAEAIQEHAKVRMIIQFLTAHVFYDLQDKVTEVRGGGARLQLYQGSYPFEACHHSLFAYLANDSLLTLRSAFESALKSAVTEDKRLDPHLVLKLLVLGIQGKDIQNTIQKIFETASELQSSDDLKLSDKKFTQGVRTGTEELFKTIQQHNQLTQNQENNIFSDRSRFSYLNNHTLVESATNPVDNWIEQDVRREGIQLFRGNLTRQQSPGHSTIQLGKSIISSAEAYAKNAGNLLDEVKALKEKACSFENARKKLQGVAQDSMQESPARLLIQFVKAFEDLRLQKQSMRTKLHIAESLKKDLSLELLTYLNQSDAFLTPLIPIIDRLSKDIEQVQQANQTIQKQASAGINALQEKCRQQEAEIEAEQAKILERKKPFQVDVDVAVAELKWNNIYNGNPSVEAINAAKAKIISEIDQQPAHIKKYQQTLYFTWNENKKATDRIASKNEKIILFKREIVDLEEKLRISKAPLTSFEQYIHSQPERRAYISEMHKKLKLHLLHNASSNPNFIFKEEDLAELKAAALSQIQGTQAIIDELGAISDSETEQKISKIIVPYLIARHIEPKAVRLKW